MTPSVRSRKGVVLLFSIAVLALLAILAVVFATTTKMERNVSRNYVDDTKARMCAEAGLETAIASLRDIAMQRAWDEPNDAWVFPLDPAQNPYRPDYGFPVELAQKPSFLGGPALPGGGAVSGSSDQQLPSSYENGRDYYRLKVVDCAAQINLNMFDIANSPSAKAVLEGMLTNLGKAIQDTIPGAINPIENQAAALTSYRINLPGGVYANEEQLVEALKTVFPSDYEKRYYNLCDFVTTQGWQDEAQHVAGNYRPALDYPIQPNRRLDVIPRKRSPVNVNTAPEAVLVAVLAGLCGHELGTAPDGAGVLGVAPIAWTKTLSTSGGNTSYISYQEARQVAQAILRQRATNGAFKTWADFESFIDGVGFTLEQRMVIKANANPNLRLNKFNPNEVVFRPIDKIDLAYYPGGVSGAPQKCGTTEFCFSSMGYFEVESLGRVSKFDGATEGVVASKVLRTVVRVYDLARVTTQKDFVDGLVACSHARSLPESIDESRYGGEKGNQPPQAANPDDGCVAIGTEWDEQPHPGQTFFHSFGDHLKSTSPQADPIVNGKHETGSVFDGNDLVPDGVLNWRHPPGQEELAFATAGEEVADDARALSGSVDLWIKLASDPSVGSDEVLFYAVKELYVDRSATLAGQAVSTPGQHWGLAWKLERFGNRIRSTRFLYGYPNREVLQPDRLAPGVLASNGQVQLSLTEVDFFCNSWKAHEWHRLTHSWTKGTEQSMTVDGQQRYGMTFQLQRIISRDVGSQFDFRPGLVFQRTVNGFRLITMNWQQRFQIGGYTYTYQNAQTPSGMTVYNQRWQVREGQTLNRYPNATIDDVRFSTSASALPPRDRYGIQGGSFWRGKVPAARLGSGRIGTVSYTVYYPKVYAGRSLTPAQLRIGFQAGFQSKGLQAAPLPQGGNSTDGEGWGVYPMADKAMPLGEDLLYEIDFQNPAGLTPLDVTPVVDDVTVTWMGAPKMMEYAWIARSEPQ